MGSDGGMRSNRSSVFMRRMGLDAFLLAEANQRVSDELAAALAALRMVKLAAGSKSRWRLLGDAIDRLEAFATTHQHFAARPPAGTKVDAAIGIEVVCTALAAARPAARGSTLALDLPPTLVDGTTARNLALVADRLVTNAITHGLEGRAGVLSVSLCRRGDDILLVVSDDGPIGPAGSVANDHGVGPGIAAELVRRSGGEFCVTKGPTGTTARIIMRHDSGSAGLAHG